MGIKYTSLNYYARGPSIHRLDPKSMIEKLCKIPAQRQNFKNNSCIKKVYVILFVSQQLIVERIDHEWEKNTEI